MFESKSGVLLLAGLGFFSLAFLSNGAVPWIMYSDKKEQTVDEMIEQQVQRSSQAKPPQSTTNVLTHFRDLHWYYRDAFVKVYGDPAAEKWDERVWQEKCVQSVRTGHRVYVAEACWHCHSQFIRPVSREAERWGPVSQNWEYNNELQKPVLFGTRRVGPDLCREGGRRPQSLARRPFRQPREHVAVVGHARVSMVLRWRPGSSKPARPGRDHVHAVPGLMAADLSLLHRKCSATAEVTMTALRKKTTLGRRLFVLLAVCFFLVPAGYGFYRKFSELLYLAGDPENSFVVMPIISYLLSSLGFAMMLFWATSHGMFHDVEQPKFTSWSRRRCSKRWRKGKKTSSGESVVNQTLSS